MPDDEFSLDDDGFGSDTESSLDDFFQPTSPKKEKEEGADQVGGEEPSIDDFFSPPSPPAGGPEPPESEGLPIEKGKVAETPPPAEPMFGTDDDEPDIVEPPPMPEEEAYEEEEGAEKGPGFLKRNLLWIVVGLAVVAVGLGGTYFAMTVLFGPDQEQVAKAPPKSPEKKASPKKAQPKKSQPAKTAAANTKTGEKGAIKAGGEAEKKPPVSITSEPETKKTAPPPEPKKEPVPPPEPQKEPKGHQPVPNTFGPYSVQVGSYMLEASKDEPERKLKELGYATLSYAPFERTLKVYHVLVGQDMTREKAQEVMKQLEDLGYAPELMPEQGGYVVKAYSYGSYSTAKSTRSKLRKAGVPPVTIRSETKQATLDQLRVGSYKTRTDANKALRDLKKNGFSSAIIVKE